MADTSKFGGARAPQFGDRISPGGDGRDSGHCSQCEAMLTDALDGTLSPAEQAMFDGHMASCEACAGMLADARRGAAWLEMLRDPRPEPRAELLERILAQTSGMAMDPKLAGPAAVTASGMPARGRVLPFRTRVWEVVRESALGQVMLQPRLAMTAAMAFFSIALTLNLTGVRLTELRPGDLKPSSLRRGFYSANARVVQYYEGLRVVYELESRVHDFETESDTGGAPTSAPPAAAPSQQTPAAQPGTGDGGSGAGSGKDKTTPRSPGPGSSRRESPIPSERTRAARQEASLGVGWYGAREEGALA